MLTIKIKDEKIENKIKNLRDQFYPNLSFSILVLEILNIVFEEIEKNKNEKI